MSNDLADKLKKLYGLPPYDEGSNFVKGDGYFSRSISAESSLAEINKALRTLGKDPWKEEKRKA